MKKEYMAYAIMKDEKREWRVNIGRDEDENECYRMKEKFSAKYSDWDGLEVVFSGVHAFYMITPGEWNAIPDDYKGHTEDKPYRRTVFEGSIPGNNGEGGTTLLTEGEHFEVEWKHPEVA